jgi:hypothetical protein
MKKIVLTLATVAALAASAVAPAEAHGLRLGHRHGLGALGALGAVAAVGLAAVAVAAATDDYGYGYGYGPCYACGGPIFLLHRHRFGW